MIEEGGGHAGPITMVAPVALVTHSGRGRHLILPRGVLGCRVLLQLVREGRYGRDGICQTLYAQ